MKNAGTIDGALPDIPSFCMFPQSPDHRVCLFWLSPNLPSRLNNKPFAIILHIVYWSGSDVQAVTVRIRHKLKPARLPEFPPRSAGPPAPPPLTSLAIPSNQPQAWTRVRVPQHKHTSGHVGTCRSRPSGADVSTTGFLRGALQETRPRPTHPNHQDSTQDKLSPLSLSVAGKAAAEQLELSHHIPPQRPVFTNRGRYLQPRCPPFVAFCHS